jgi:hypothetical protein
MFVAKFLSLYACSLWNCSGINILMASYLYNILISLPVSTLLFLCWTFIFFVQFPLLTIYLCDVGLSLGDKGKHRNMLFCLWCTEHHMHRVLVTNRLKTVICLSLVMMSMCSFCSDLWMAALTAKLRLLTINMFSHWNLNHVVGDWCYLT